MANDLNQCTFTGRLGKDVETRYTQSGDAMASFSIAVGSQWKSKSGEKQEATEWVNISAFGKLAEICDEYLSQGSHVLIVGRMKTDKYTDKAGIEKYSTKIIAEKMQMLGSRNDSTRNNDTGISKGASQGARAIAAPVSQPVGNSAAAIDDLDDDIPF